MIIGLRIDVDTYRGTRLGVPRLCALLAEHGIRASFFFSVGPDNMGRHIRRLLRPAFFWKMLRTRAASLYGWDILLRGTFWQGPVIGRKLGGIIRATAASGHEIGLHAWDHYAWQSGLDQMSSREIRVSLDKGVQLLKQVLGFDPVCSAAPAWKCNESVLLEKERYAFKYNSDCRGKTIFRPMIGAKEGFQPQVPVTLPTYDELIGQNGLDDEYYNAYLFSLLKPNGLNVLTIHAEVEGIARATLFEQFLVMARERGIRMVPLGELLRNAVTLDWAAIERTQIPGREGWVACQAGTEEKV